MAASINEILSTTITTGVVRREVGVNRFLLQYFGFQPGGFAENPVGHRKFGYDIFNDTRVVAQGRAPGTSAATVTRQPVGRVDGVFPRFYEKLNLMSEELHNFRVLGGPNSTFDSRGVRYVQAQQRYMGQRIGNVRAALLMGMLRGKMYIHRTGDDVWYDFTSTAAVGELDWRMPAANMTDVGGIIATSWDNPAADIPGQLRNLHASRQAATGTGVFLIIAPMAIWNNIVKNDEVAAQAGTSNTPFIQQEIQLGNDPGTGRPQTVIIGRIAAVPWIVFLITNEGVKLGVEGSQTFTQFIDDTAIWWGPQPSRDLFEMLLGSEPVSEGYGAQDVERIGVHAWTKVVDDPAGRQLFSLDNCVPANYIPNSNGYATVVY